MKPRKNQKIKLKNKSGKTVNKITLSCSEAAYKKSIKKTTPNRLSKKVLKKQVIKNLTTNFPQKTSFARADKSQTAI